MSRHYSHPGPPRPHAVTLLHSDPPTYAGHSTEVARWRIRRGHRPKWARQSLPEKIATYARALGRGDDRMTEVVLIGSAVNGGMHAASDIDLVCVFEPDFAEVGNGYATIRRLTERLRPVETAFALGCPLDVGWIDEGGSIWLGGGLVSHYRDGHKILWERKNEDPGGNRGSCRTLLETESATSE